MMGEVTMEFIPKSTRLSSGYEVDWMIVDRLTKSFNFRGKREDCMVEESVRWRVGEMM